MGQAVVVLFLVTVVLMVLEHIFPGGPVRALVGERATAQQIAYYNHLYGFDQPIYVQYGKWVWQLAHGNLGYSPRLNQTVASEIVLYLPKTMLLVGLALAASLIFGVPLGIYQAVRRYTAGDYALTWLAFVGYATPVFFVGLLLIQWFSLNLHLLPSEAPQGNSAAAAILSQPLALVLPVFSLAFVLFALWSRYMRSSVMDNLVQDYVRTARAKRASERRVLWGHIFRNSLMSIVTLLGLQIPFMVAGVVAVEVVFNYPGMGLAFYQAAQSVDFPTLLGFTVVATVTVIVANLLADLGYAILDPRVRYA
jgi:peptide/nickel transport system permease protein